jgi:hypothetical protein
MIDFSPLPETSYPGFVFLEIWVSGIIAHTNSKGDKESPWNIPLLTPSTSIPVRIFHAIGKVILGN